jgi:hypothetical protein
LIESCPACEECPTHGIYAFLGYDAFRGIADEGWGNNGIHAGFNYGTRLGALSDATGIGFQIGASGGAYNWSGTNYRFQYLNRAGIQGFVTYGFFRKANAASPFTAAIVQDWMLNHNFGQYAENPTLSQWRAQVGYLTSDSNEFGLWGTWRGQSDTRDVGGPPWDPADVVGPTTWRAISQLNAYWHHKWEVGGADSWLWFGVPERTRITGGSSLGDYLAGAAAQVPFNDQIVLYTLITYMHPSAGAGEEGSVEDAWNFTIGLAFYPSARARTSTVAGQCWMPQLPVANNGYLLVDVNNW